MGHDFSNVTALDRLCDAVLHHGLVRPIYRRHARGVDLAGDERVLEFGAGSGAISRHLAPRLDRGGWLVCLDTSEAWLEVAKTRLRRFDNVEFLAGDLLDLDLSARSFDTIVIHFVLHEVEPDRRADTLGELARILRDDGRLFIIEPTREEHGIPARRIRRLMAEAGLQELSGAEHKPFLFGPSYDGVYGK